jgi:phosphoglycolate phosphatase
MKAFFFDLDGTLCDSRPGLIHSLKAAFAALDIETAEDLSIFLGAPLPVVFKTLMPDADDIDIAYGIRKFREAYETTGILHTPLYPRASDVLTVLKATGKAVWLATSKPQPYAERILQNLGIAHHFDGVVGAGLDEKDTKAGIVAKALRASRIAPQECLMLGDRAFDITGALDNGIAPVGALWGYGTRKELAESGCTAFARDFSEFEDLFMA